jgi:hypothetical protein
MDVKGAVRIALAHVRELFEDEKISDLGLEEVVFDESAGRWEVTVGFSRPWDYPKPNILASMSMQETEPRRSYKVVRVDSKSGTVDSVTIRERT